MGSQSEPFCPVGEKEYPIVLDILRQRLPISGHVYNMLLALNKFPEDMSCYTLNNDLDLTTAIILVIMERMDYGQDINISIPSNFHVTEEIKNDFAASKVIDWTGIHMFVAVDRRISRMIFDISTLIHRNSVIFNPNYSYWLDPKKAECLNNINITSEKVQVQELDDTEGLKFLVDHWKYARPGGEEYVRKIINRHFSVGLRDDGAFVSGAIVNAHGLIGLLATNEAYKNKSYATKCMQFLFKELHKKGYAIVSTSQQENFYSVALHQKLGMEVTHESDYIFHIPLIPKSKK